MRRLRSRISFGLFMQTSPFLPVLPSETGGEIRRVALPGADKDRTAPACGVQHPENSTTNSPTYCPENRDWQNFEVFLTDVVSSFVFSLKLPPESEKKTARLTFLGKQIDFFMGKGSGRLAGFATDNQVIIENFRKEVSFLENHIVEKYLDQSKLETYLENLITEGLKS